MQTTTSKSAYLAAIVFIIVVALFCLFICSRALAFQKGTYGDSAHGNAVPGYGVNGSTAACENWPGTRLLPMPFPIF